MVQTVTLLHFSCAAIRKRIGCVQYCGSNIYHRSDNHCELVLPLPHISRQHFVLTPQTDGVRIRDLGSTNGTLVNGVLVQEAVLHHGDILTIAGLTLVLEYCGATEGIFVARKITNRNAPILATLAANHRLIFHTKN